MNHTELAIANAAGAVWSARQHLAELLTTNCPGPHAFVQHRDGKPPWCKTCRYTPDGRYIDQETR